MSTETDPNAREVRFFDHVSGDLFLGPRAPALLLEDASAPDARRVIVAGDTLEMIAHQEYGDVTLWWVLADANDVIDPFNLPVGEELRIPPLDRVLLEVLA